MMYLFLQYKVEVTTHPPDNRVDKNMGFRSKQTWLASNFSFATLLIAICRKRSVFIPIPKKGNPKECSNYRIIALISHTSKVVLKILQARLQQ